MKTSGIIITRDNAIDDVDAIKQELLPVLKTASVSTERSPYKGFDRTI